MKRYLSSFFITLFIYLTLAGTFFVILANNVIIKKTEKKNKIISLQHIKLVEKEVIEEIKQSTVIKEPEKITVLKQKVKKQKVKKKIIKKKVKKIVKKKKKIIRKKKKVKKKIKKILKKEIIKKRVVPKPVEVKQKIIGKKSIDNNISKKTSSKKQIIKKPITYKEDFLKKNLYLIQKAIQKSIVYPKRAKRIGVQGRIVLEFTLLSNGKLKNLKIISGHKLLRKATIKALKKASVFFPIVKKMITIRAPISYTLR